MNIEEINKLIGEGKWVNWNILMEIKDSIKTQARVPPIRISGGGIAYKLSNRFIKKQIF